MVTKFLGHLCIAVNARMILVALLLNMAGTDDTLAYLSRTLARSCLGEFLETKRCYLYLEIYTVEDYIHR